MEDYSQMLNKEFIEILRNISYEYTRVSMENYKRRINKSFSEEELNDVRNIEFVMCSKLLEYANLKGKDMESSLKEFLNKFDDPNR